MQLNQLKLPTNSKKITFEIASNGQTTVKTKSQKRENIRSAFSGKLEGCKIELGQLNSIHLSKDTRFQDLIQHNPFVSIRTPQPPKSHDPKRKLKCNCKKSKCLKLYCECFSNSQFCGEECVCLDCSNLSLNSKTLQQLREEMNTKRPVQGKGCKCTKSNCQKKYCDCFNRGVSCGQNCSCQNCENGHQARDPAL